MRGAICLVVGALICVGCGDDSSAASDDAASDATTETTTDAAIDSRSEAIADAGGDTRADTASDADAAEADGAPTRTLHCFSSPGACGFPDPKFGNVGVPAGTTLTPSSSMTITTAGAVVEGCDVTGSIEIAANDVTIRNCRITVPAPGCGTATTCGNWNVLIDPAVTGTKLSHVELAVAPGATVEHAVRNRGAATTHADHLYVNGPDAGWFGPGTVEDSYILAALAIGDDHLETSYYGGAGGALVMNHDTLLNPEVQTATVFVKADFGTVSTLTITNNLLAGGGYTLYGGVATSASDVTGPVTVTGNHFARCGGGKETDGGGGHWICAGGPDGDGYYPRGGSYGWQADFNASVTTWSDNVWDDDGSAVTGP